MGVRCDGDSGGLVGGDRWRSGMKLWFAKASEFGVIVEWSGVESVEV